LKEPDGQGPYVVGWIVFILFTLLCGMAAYIQCTGIRQLPL
jgi:hypothetical protein